MTRDRPALRPPPIGRRRSRSAPATAPAGPAASRLLPLTKRPPRCGGALAGLVLRLALTALAAVAAPAGAVGLGEIELHSRLGEPLRAVVPLTGDAAAQVAAACFRLAPGGEDDLPTIHRARMSVERHRGQPVLRVATGEAIHHPIAVLALRVGCGAELTRRYMLLLSPPEAAAPAPIETATAPVSASPVVPARPTADRPAPPRRNASPGHASHRAAPPALRSDAPAGRSRQASGRNRPAPQRDHLSISGSEPAPLRLATFLGEAGRSGEDAMSEEQRSLLRTEQRLLQALEDKIVEELSLADKIRRLEAVIAELQGSLGQRPAAPALAAPEARPPAVEVPPAGSDATPRAVSAAPPAEATAASPARDAAATPRPAGAPERSTGRDLLLLAGITAAVALVLGLLTRRRRHAERFAEFQAEALDPPGDEAVVTPEDEYQATVRFNRPIIEAAARAPAQAHELDTMAQPLPAQVQAPDIDVSEHESAMELAEIMLSFGRVKGAAQTLADYIAHNPRQAVEPWLKLLDVYRGAGMRGEWEALAGRLNQTFNVEVPQWDGLHLSPAAQALEDYPHVVARLMETWPGPQALDYLNQLLKDTRNGTRAGFPMAVLNEILMLVAVLEAERPVITPAKAETPRLESPRRAVG